MKRFAKSLISKPVILKREKAILGIIEELVINPDNGKLIGALIREGFGKKNLKAIAEKDILLIGTNYFLVDDYSVIGELDEIVRVKSILDKNIKIIDNQVVTVTGIKLGKAYDFTIDSDNGYLLEIYVNPPFLFSFSEDLIIPFEKIVAIESDKIIVEDSFIKESNPVTSEEPEVI